MKTVLITLLFGVQIGLIVYALRILFTMIFLILYRNKQLPFVPSVPKIVRMIARSGAIQPHDRVVDLGCGTGTILVGLAWRMRAISCVGIEQEAMLATAARLRSFIFGKRVKILCGDMFEYPLHDANVVVGFWITELMPRIVEKITRECATGTRIVSHMFPLPEHPRLQLANTLQKKGHIVRIYTLV